MSLCYILMNGFLVKYLHFSCMCYMLTIHCADNVTGCKRLPWPSMLIEMTGRDASGVCMCQVPVPIVGCNNHQGL